MLKEPPPGREGAWADSPGNSGGLGSSSGIGVGFQRGAGGSSLEPVWGRGRGTCLKSAPCRTVASWLLLEASVPLPPTGRPPLLRPRSLPGSRRRKAGTAPGGRSCLSGQEVGKWRAAGRRHGPRVRAPAAGGSFQQLRQPAPSAGSFCSAYKT